VLYDKKFVARDKYAHYCSTVNPLVDITLTKFWCHDSPRPRTAASRIGAPNAAPAKCCSEQMFLLAFLPPAIALGWTKYLLYVSAVRQQRTLQRDLSRRSNNTEDYGCCRISRISWFCESTTTSSWQPVPPFHLAPPTRCAVSRLVRHAHPLYLLLECRLIRMRQTELYEQCYIKLPLAGLSVSFTSLSVE